MRASDYATDPDFRAFLSIWLQQRRPVLEWSDWLRDRGLEQAAEAVAWAAARSDSPAFGSHKHSGPFPTFPRYGSPGCYWHAISAVAVGFYYCDCLPPEQKSWSHKYGGGYLIWPTAEAAILALLDNWVVEAADTQSGATPHTKPAEAICG